MMFINYSFYRIKRVLKNDYGIILKKRQQGYKANRRKGYKERYDMITEEGGQIILSDVNLNAIRSVLTQENYPLYDEKSEVKK